MDFISNRNYLIINRFLSSSAVHAGNASCCAANRGVVSSGPYRLVRHPIYLGYLVTHAGFLLSNTSVRNVAIYAAAYVFQFARIYAEERILAQDGEYREYLRSVRYRLFPEVY